MAKITLPALTFTKAEIRALEFDMRMNGSWQSQPKLYAAVKAALNVANTKAGVQ